MRKQVFLLFATVLIVASVRAQPDKVKYPDPEFTNEVCWLKRDDSAVVPVRLEKTISKMETKMKLAGMGGSESGYNIPGEKSSVRLRPGNHSFIISNGSTGGSATNNATSDSILRSQGIDPAMMESMSKAMDDPANSISLYKITSQKGARKIYIMKVGGMGLGAGKNQSSDKISFSVRKIRSGYWELVLDKPLSKGEYAFSKQGGPGAGGMDQSILVFAFGVD